LNGEVWPYRFSDYLYFVFNPVIRVKLFYLRHVLKQQ